MDILRVGLCTGFVCPDLCVYPGPCAEFVLELPSRCRIPFQRVTLGPAWPRHGGIVKRVVDELSEIRVEGAKRLIPTPDILDALEQAYPIEASLADLVDNSIDANAKNVLIRFRIRGRRLVGLCVVDDGHGIKPESIDHAMRFADRRRYGKNELGMYGVGLKTASLSQAEVVTVLSRAPGRRATGRQWVKSDIKNKNWQLNVISEASAEGQLVRKWGGLGSLRRGTIIRWDKVTDFDRQRGDIHAYIQSLKVKIQNHLGLKLCRFLAKRKLRVHLDTEDMATGEVGPPTAVKPLSPFPGRELAPVKGYPKTFRTEIPKLGRLEFVAHIWPKRSTSEGYRLGGGKVAQHQGIYFFRHDRLISEGGWYGLRGPSEPHLTLARVEADIPDELAAYLKVTPNKASVDAPTSFSSVLEKAVAKDGTRFTDYLRIAVEVARTRGKQRARPLLCPGDGIPADVKAALDRKGARYHSGKPLTIAWAARKHDRFFDIDLRHRTVVLNLKYRSMLLRGAHGGATDVPILRTLLYFGLEGILAGRRIGKVEGLRLAEIQAALHAALRLEEQWAGA